MTVSPFLRRTIRIFQIDKDLIDNIKKKNCFYYNRCFLHRIVSFRLENLKRKGALIVVLTCD